MRIEEVFNKEEKARICLDILHALPDWFAMESSVLDYAAQVKEQSFFAAFTAKRAFSRWKFSQPCGMKTIPVCFWRNLLVIQPVDNFAFLCYDCLQLNTKRL